MFFLFTALLGLSLTNAVSADDYYVGIEAGPNWLNSSKHHWRDNNNGRIGRHHVDVDFDTGYLVGGLVGYRWCNNISAEVEFAFRNNKVDKVKFKNRFDDDCITVCDKGRSHHKDHHKDHHRDHKRHRSSHGELRSSAVLFNARYDMAMDCCFTPYIKGGIGYANSKLHHNSEHRDSRHSNVHHDSHHNNGHHDVVNNDCHDKRHNSHRRKGFAYQVGVGVSFPIYDCTTLDIGYNFLRAQKDLNNSSLVFAARYGF